jgi:hypothetical protein
MFATGALGPVNYAGQCILSRRPEEGLRELAVEGLRGGVARGVLQAAQRVGVSPSDIERLLPMAELDRILARLAVSQPQVIEAWKLYAGGLGGLLAGVADLTVDGRAPDTALAVSRLAKKVSRDKPLAEPLQRLAEDLFDWQDALHRCVELLNDTTALEKAYQRRRLKRVLAAFGMAAVLLIGLAFFVRARVARARVLDIIDKPDPCAAMELTEADLDRVSDELRTRASQSRAACETKRAEEAKRQQEGQARAEREAQEKKAKEALEAQCDALAGHVEAGQVPADDAAVAKDAAPLLGRIAKGALALDDLGPNEPALPCKGTKAEARLAAAFRKAVLAKPWNVPKAAAPSAAVRDALAQGAADLPDKLKMMMGTRAGDAAKRAIAAGKPDAVARALALCDAAKALGTAPAGPCDGVRAIAPK